MTVPKIPTSDIEVAVTLGRIEEGIKGLRESVDRLLTSSEKHDTTLGAHEARLQVLESRQSPRIHPVTVLAGIASILAVALVVLDRIIPV